MIGIMEAWNNGMTEEWEHLGNFQYPTICCSAVARLWSVAPLAADQRANTLWTIGKHDNSNAEFALAPKGYGVRGICTRTWSCIV